MSLSPAWIPKASRIVGKTSVEVSAGVVLGSLTDKNFGDPAAALSLVRTGLAAGRVQRL